MNIGEDFSHKIIISATGETQIKLLCLIYQNINVKYNKNYFLGRKHIINGISDSLKNFRKDNIRPELITVHNTENVSMNRGTVYTKMKLQKYYKYEIPIKDDSFYKTISFKIELSAYKLVNMKTFIKFYGKYLFDNKDHRDRFINSYPELDISPIFQVIKQITF